MLENASTDLKCIMEHGYFKLIINAKEINVSKMDGRESDESHSNFFLHFNSKKLSCVSERWSNKHIDDFVQKLGFLESQTTDVDQQVKSFQQLNQVHYLHIM